MPGTLNVSYMICAVPSVGQSLSEDYSTTIMMMMMVTVMVRLGGTTMFQREDLCSLNGNIIAVCADLFRCGEVHTSKVSKILTGVS